MIQLNSRDSRPIYEQIMDNFRRLIVSGGMASGEKLPSVRELATQLAINPNTIQRAYRELETEGYIVTLPGKGSFAAERQPVEEKRLQDLWRKFDAVAQELRYCGAQQADFLQHLKEECSE